MTDATLAPDNLAPDNSAPDNPAPVRQPSTPARETFDTARLEGVLLLRLAVAGGATRADATEDVAPLVAHRISRGDWHAVLEACLDRLVRDGLAAAAGPRFTATPDGVVAALRLLGGRRALPRSWAEARDIRLVARALGVDDQPAARLRLLVDPEGLRALLLQQRYSLPRQAAPTPARLRAALADVVLERAPVVSPVVSGGTATGKATVGKGRFGIGARREGLRLTPQASRQLAGQLARQPRAFDSDRRLVAELAAEQAGAVGIDAEALRLGILRAFVGGQDVAARARRPRRKVKARLGRAAASGRGDETANGRMPLATKAPASMSSAATPSPSDPELPIMEMSVPEMIAAGLDAEATASPATHPALDGFVALVRTHARATAHGWSGDRRAFISHVWQSMRARGPDRRLGEGDFKAQLIEAHKRGLLTLAHADLKDRDSLQDVRESAIAYKNTVWHYIRVPE